MHLWVSTHICQKHAPPRLWGALRHVAQYTVLPQKCSKLKIISNHSNMTVNIQLWFGSLKWLAGGKKRRRFIAPPPYIRWLSAWLKHADNLSMIPALRGEGLPSTCFISATHLSSSVPPPTPPPPHSSLLPPASLVIQISLLSAHISEAPQFACQLA